MRLLLALLTAFTLAAAAPGPVVLLSFDGLSAAHFSAASMPRVWKLSEAGFRGEGIPPFPCTTFNGHVTLATGCWPGHHGVVANAFVDPAQGFVGYSGTAEQLQREPLWVAATRSGVPTAVYHWVAATGPWEGVRPWRLQRYDPKAHDRDALAFVDRALAEGASLVMAYLSGIDTEGHLQGPRSGDVKAKLQATDALVGPWLERLLARRQGVRVVLVADHGMAAMAKGVDLVDLLEGLPVTVVAHGGSAYVYLTGAAPGALAEVLRRTRGAGLQAWPRAEAPAEFRLEDHPRVGDAVVLAPMGTWLGMGRNPAERAAERAGRTGAHGYAGSPAEMHTWLVVLGAGKGALGEVPLWDVAPTLAAWLGIAWVRPPDGAPVPALVPRPGS